VQAPEKRERRGFFEWIRVVSCDFYLNFFTVYETFAYAGFGWIESMISFFWIKKTADLLNQPF
jgi:hypothetical protein